MKRMERGGMSDGALKPVGFAMSAVMAGLAAQGGAAALTAPSPVASQRAHFIDPSNDPRHDEDASLILGPSTPVEPFAEAPASKKQGDLFDL